MLAFISVHFFTVLVTANENALAAVALGGLRSEVSEANGTKQAAQSH